MESLGINSCLYQIFASHCSAVTDHKHPQISSNFLSLFANSNKYMAFFKFPTPSILIPVYFAAYYYYDISINSSGYNRLAQKKYNSSIDWVGIVIL